MKSKIFLFGVVLLSVMIISACSPISPTASLPTPTAEIKTSTSIPTPIAEIKTSTPLPTMLPVTETSTPATTTTLELTPAPNIIFDPQANAERITFAPFATWAEVNSSISGGAGKRFVLSALQYQVMSVSILQGPPFSVEVTGVDKTSLTNPQNPQFFWRGGLPSTQDYLVTVTSPIDGPFTLRIAINPQGLAYQTFEFKDPQVGVILDYSDEFSPTSWQLPFMTKGTPLLNLYFIEPSYYYPTTNLVEAGIVLTATADPGIVSTCTQPSTQVNEIVSGQVTANGYTFTRSELSGVAAGNEYDQIFYRTVSGGRCFEVILLVHSGNIGNYPPGTVVEFDFQRLLHKFEAVLGTFSAK